jgi:glycosyltransferase involved in cell wall biosynthesis
VAGEANGLQVQLDHPLPAEVEVGAGTAVFVCGWCFNRDAKVRSLALRVDGSPQPLMAYGMPRSDVFTVLHPAIDSADSAPLTSDPDSPSDPQLLSFRSGFWGLAHIGPREPGSDCRLELRAELEGGGTALTELGRLEIGALPAEPAALEAPEPAAGPLVAICMASHEPPPALFRLQLDSIRAQTHRNWICVISDDCSGPTGFAELQAAVGGDPRFLVSRSPRRLGFYRNFERALALAPAAADYVALADQDDRWRPEKLETLLGAIGGARLVYSDQRIVSPEGELLAETYWSRRDPNHDSLLSLLVANSVTGAASLFPRDLLDFALPFPPRQFTHFHDHWIALCAASLGEIAFVERPLYDYVQHKGAVLGHAAANRMPTLRDRAAKLREDPRERVRRWRLHYFVDCCRLIQFTTILEMRLGDRITPVKRRELARFARAERSPGALAALARGAARELRGRRPQTLGAEVALFFAFAWRRLVVEASRGLVRPRRRLRIDARPPTSLTPVPGRTAHSNIAVGTLAAKIAPLELAIDENAPARVNILIPTIDLTHFFGGYITKLNLARRLAERGARVRIVTVDPVGPLPAGWQRTLESYSGLAGLFDRVEVAFGREAQGVEVSRDDRFVATTWWTAHVAASALDALGGGRFLYLIQEYEPFTFPMGSYAALAADSYRLPHRALFSSELLREYFSRHALGVFERGERAGRRDSASFRNAITAIEPPSAQELAGRRSRRLLFYARPEAHAARNMFELGVLALSRAVEGGLFAEGWELNGIGTVEGERRIQLGGGASLDLLPRQAQHAYADVLRGHDLGLALMLTPHPSLVPLEMASAGMATVTNSFENKTPAELEAISPNLIVADPSLDALADALSAAVERVEDFDARAQGSHLRWSRSWAESFDDELMERVEGLLER